MADVVVESLAYNSLYIESKKSNNQLSTRDICIYRITVLFLKYYVRWALPPLQIQKFLSVNAGYANKNNLGFL